MANLDVDHGFTGQCFPEVFTKPPPQPAEKKPGQLTPDQLNHFFEQGYVLITDYFKKEDLDACKDAVDQVVDELAQKLYKGGKIKSLYDNLGFFDRLTKLEEEFPGANVVLHKKPGLPQAFKDLWTNERLLNAIEQIIGPDIAGHPVWNLRTKTPNNVATTVPWHQDAGYLDNEAYDVLVPTAWIPLLDADENNGCMQVISGGHRKGLVATHTCCYASTHYIMLDEDEMNKTLGVDTEKDIRTIPVPYGGMLLLNNLIPHRSLPNRTKQIRWSLDFRWQSPHKPVGFYGMKGDIPFRLNGQPIPKIEWETKEERFHIFGRDENDLDTIITGPWMKKWEITHPNRHTEMMKSVSRWRDKA